MSEKFRFEGHVYYSSPERFFRDAIEISRGEFYKTLFRRLKQLKVLA